MFEFPITYFTLIGSVFLPLTLKQGNKEEIYTEDYSIVLLITPFQSRFLL